MLKSWQLAGSDLLNDTSHARFGDNIGLRESDSFRSSHVLNELVRRGLASNNGQNIALRAQCCLDDRDANVSGSPY